MPDATISSLWRHPVKGFTPEPVSEASLAEGGFFPCDRQFTIEVGTSGFEPDAPKTVSKMKFAVLARFAAVARLHTRYDEAKGVFTVTHDDGARTSFSLFEAAGRAALGRHVETMLAQHEDYDPARAPLHVLAAPDVDPPFRFTDSGKGFVSFLNLNSLRDMESRFGVALDPLRLRANIWVEGWSAFEDHRWVGRTLRAGEDGPEFEILKPIVRCVATHVNPVTAERDIDLCTALWENYGHRDCGIYARVVKGGVVRPGDRLQLA